MLNRSPPLKASPGQADTTSRPSPNLMTVDEARMLVAQATGMPVEDIQIEAIHTVDALVPDELLGKMGRALPQNIGPYTIADADKHVTATVKSEPDIYAALAERAKTQPSLNAIINEVRREVERAVAKHGPMKSAHEAAAVIREEYEELWDEVKADRGYQSSARAEAIQLAAMAIRYLYDLDPGRSRF